MKIRIISVDNDPYPKHTPPSYRFIDLDLFSLFRNLTTELIAKLIDSIFQIYVLCIETIFCFPIQNTQILIYFRFYFIHSSEWLSTHFQRKKWF